VSGMLDVVMEYSSLMMLLFPFKKRRAREVRSPYVRVGCVGDIKLDGDGDGDGVLEGPFWHFGPTGAYSMIEYDGCLHYFFRIASQSGGLVLSPDHNRSIE